MEKIRSDTDARVTKARDEHDRKSNELEEEIRAMTLSLEEDGAKNRDTETALRKKKEKIEAEVNELKAKYEKDVQDLKDQIEDVKQKMAKEKEELRVLEEHFAKVDANEARKTNEEALLDAFRAKVRHAERVLEQHATRIQKVVRGKQLRAFIRQLMSKKKGKKGGGKGGKKKK